VSLPGILRGEGARGSLHGAASNVSLSGTPEFVCVDYEIQNVSKQRPGGSYQLSVNAEIIAVNTGMVFWLAAVRNKDIVRGADLFASRVTSMWLVYSTLTR
jgi:hypothetical protein